MDRCLVILECRIPDAGVRLHDLGEVVMEALLQLEAAGSEVSDPATATDLEEQTLTVEILVRGQRPVDALDWATIHAMPAVRQAADAAGVTVGRFTAQFAARPMDGNHLPVHYRPERADRHEAPADVCGTCSDFESGRLVPVSFCREAAPKSAEEYDHLTGGPEPDWMWQQGPDATSAVLG